MKNIQQTVQAILDEQVGKGIERGAQFTAYHQGQLLVEAFAGTMEEGGKPVEATTLFPVFSTTKGIAATLLHLLVERGKISYETPIAEVWPEFAAHGKVGITLRHALNHTAGLPNMPPGISHAQLDDWNAMCAKMAETTPVSAPGAVAAYHAITYSWLVGEVARRVDGRPFAKMMREEISKPLGMADEMFVGIPDAVERRVALLEADPLALLPVPKPEEENQAIPAMVLPLHEWMNRPDARRACIPASNGIMTATAVARHYAALLPGGIEGIEILPPERIRLATEAQYATLAPETPSPWALGYGKGAGFSSTAFGHGGYGGSNGFADPALGLAVGFARNRMSPESALLPIIEALKQALG